MDPRSDPLCLCMTFIHEDLEFDQLLRIVADKRRLSLGLTEKDYWVTHALWALHDAGFEVWFKGGTSLSKGFSLIQRFSEDLDLKLEAGSVELPRVTDWSRTGTGATKARRAYFEALAERIQIPGARTEEDALPPLADYPDVRALAEEMIRQKQIAVPPAGDVRHFLPGGAGTVAIQAAFEAIAPMFWGPRQTLDEAVAALCAWLTRFHFASR
ncbi:nucleotidyl transferase AbiEii/AbiGii toxin family protein [Corallococcus exiguus]|uniref:nucleotidyl transferase AbiEii/AbiGii toxin family protein n=1 Tax=Corallococcus exiguus TaxID=83462 RepID=UPI003457613E